tara:strand:+ start:177 stop:401 length:225 start_codon:yes stop_codon:yes gene_type:complete
MKFVLSMILCSSISGTCLEPYPMEKQYDDLYSCLQGGYSESIIKTESIGPKDVNEHKIFIKFFCQELKAEGVNA